MGDFRGIPTPICPACGSNLIQITASFDPLSYEINMYLLDNAKCANCDALLIAPTPADYTAA
jgi:hypothetical protein